jgi:hypothetical protein
MQGSPARRIAALFASSAIMVGLLAVGSPALAATPLAAPLPRVLAAAATDSCGYDSTTFSESTITRSAAVYGSGLSATVGVFSNDEKAMLLGVNGATANTSSPQHVSSPSIGDPSQKDPSGRVFYPAL